MNYEKFVFCSDLHGDKQDSDAVDVLFDFTDDFKPTIRVFGGDLWDFRSLRRKASAEEQRDSMREDYDAGMRFLMRYKPQHFILGNHDARLWYWRDNGVGVMHDLAQQGIDDIEKNCAKIKCHILPYHKSNGILRIGHLKMLHGFYCGVTAARRHALVYGSCLFGHTHAIDSAPIPGLEQRIARNVGCLADLTELTYADAKPESLRHANGFCYGWVNTRTGGYHCEQAESVDGKWIMPTSYKEF